MCTISPTLTKIFFKENKKRYPPELTSATMRIRSFVFLPRNLFSYFPELCVAVVLCWRGEHASQWWSLWLQKKRLSNYQLPCNHVAYGSSVMWSYSGINLGLGNFNTLPLTSQLSHLNIFSQKFSLHKSTSICSVHKVKALAWWVQVSESVSCFRSERTLEMSIK